MRNVLRFYFDQHVPPAVADGLRRRGVEVLTTQEADRCSSQDRDQLDFATAQGSVLFTEDADFLKLHAEGREHAGIVYVKQGSLSIGDLVRGLMLIYEVLTPEDMRNHVEFL